MTATINIDQQLQADLKELHLPSFRQLYEPVAEQAKQEQWGYRQYLFELSQKECQDRRQRRIERLLRQSRLPLEKRLENFDLKRLPRKVAQQVRTLLDGSFIDRCDNVLAFGNPGSGKSHLLCAIAQEIIQQGRRVYYAPCSLLVQELLIAKRDLRLPRVIKKLSRYALLLIDDIGYVQQNRAEMEVLFTLLAERYERGSVMITSNLPFSAWEAIFKDPMTTAAAIDRLVHHCVVLELNIDSYRLEQAKKRQKSPPTDAKGGKLEWA